MEIFLIMLGLFSVFGCYAIAQNLINTNETLFEADSLEEIEKWVSTNHKKAKNLIILLIISYVYYLLSIIFCIVILPFSVYSIFFTLSFSFMLFDSLIFKAKFCGNLFHTTTTILFSIFLVLHLLNFL